MKKEDIVKLFIENGFQLTESALPLVDNPKSLITELKNMKPKPFFVTSKHIEKIKNPKKKREIKIKIDDVVKCLQAYYKRASKKILHEKKLKNLLSINKINKNSIDFSLIGMIKEKKGKKVKIEDLTGEIDLYLKNDMELDDYIFGFVCQKQGEKIKALDVIKPKHTKLKTREKLFFNLVD